LWVKVKYTDDEFLLHQLTGEVGRDGGLPNATFLLNDCNDRYGLSRTGLRKTGKEVFLFGEP
jgi:hypothetical protein